MGVGVSAARRATCQRSTSAPPLLALAAHSRLGEEGKIQRTEVVHVIVRRCFDYTKLLGKLTAIENDKQPVLTLSRADEKASPFVPMEKPLKSLNPETADYLHKGRNFK